MNTNILSISLKKIKEEVARTRGQYMNHYGNNLPFNAELLLEQEYGMKIIPTPKLKSLSIECAFCRGGNAILIDEADYSDPTKSNRLMSTFAHELGHKVLHEKHLPYVRNIDADDMEKIEAEARAFAAEFLMPEHMLLGVIASEILGRLDGIVGKDLTIEACAEYRLYEIAEYFSVSAEDMRIRISEIDLSDVLSGPYISHSDITNLEKLSSNVKVRSVAPQVVSDARFIQ